jgi:hypothetical protein
MDLADTEVSPNGEKRRESKARKLHGLMQVKSSKSVSISLDSFSGRPIASIDNQLIDNVWVGSHLPP